MKTLDYRGEARANALLGIVVALVLQLIFAGVSAAVVLNFDDLDPNTVLTGGSYGDLTWEQGNAGDLGYPGVWVVPPAAASSHPHSLPRNIANGNGSTLMGIRFPTPVNLSGVFVAVQGNGQSAWALGLHVHGYLGNQFVADAAPLNSITTTPTWLDMTALMNVNRIVFEAQPPSAVEAYYALDDLTFTYVPEPASLSLLALGGLLLRRRRSR